MLYEINSWYILGDKVAAHKGVLSKQIFLEIYSHRSGDEMWYCIMVVMVGWIYIIFLGMEK